MDQAGGLTTYSNYRYFFRIDLPKWWEQHVKVQHLKGIGGAEAVIHFDLKYRKRIHGKSSTRIFSLLVFHESKTDWLNKYGDSPLQFIAVRDRRVIAYLQPSEPPEEFLKRDGTDYNRQLLEFRWLSRMINHDLPRVFKSFRFFQRKRKKCGCSC